MDYICGISRIVGFWFFLYLMMDDFISVIKLVLKKIDIFKVWMKIDYISIVLCGLIDYVFDVVKVIYFYVVNSEKYIVMNGMFFIGCLGDI